MTKLVFLVLLNLCRGRAAVMIRRQKAQQNGFEAYRYLGERCDVKTEGRTLTDLATLMSPAWRTDHFEDDLEEWEGDVDEYEKESGKVFPLTHMKAILTEHAPEDVKGHLLLNASRIKTYQQAKDEVIAFLRGKRKFGSKKKKDHLKEQKHTEEEKRELARQEEFTKLQIKQIKLKDFNHTALNFAIRP